MSNTGQQQQLQDWEITSSSYATRCLKIHSGWKGNLKISILPIKFLRLRQRSAAFLGSLLLLLLLCCPPFSKKWLIVITDPTIPSYIIRKKLFKYLKVACKFVQVCASLCQLCNHNHAILNGIVKVSCKFMQISFFLWNSTDDHSSSDSSLWYHLRSTVLVFLLLYKAE